MVRISFIGQSDSFRIRVDQEPTQKFRNAELSNIIAQLDDLGYGDIVVWEDQRNDSGRELSHPKVVTDWWFKYLKQSRCSFYSIPQRKDFFSAEFIHWVAPFSGPRPLSDAEFFINGERLGGGPLGFQNMIKRIEAMKFHSVPIFAPRVKNEGQESPWIAFEQLFSWAKEAGLAKEFDSIAYDRLAEFTDWGRFMDDN